MKNVIAFISLIFILVVFASCGPLPTNTRYEEAAKAEQAAEKLRFTTNAERDNIKRRLEKTANPEQIGYIALVHYTGKIAMYTPVKGKVTSGGKRLTPPQCLTNEFNCSPGEPAPSDEGTWGSSNPYIYFWSPSGQYFQTDMPYIYSDKPLRVTEAPLIAIDE